MTKLLSQIQYPIMCPIHVPCVLQIFQIYLLDQFFCLKQLQIHSNVSIPDSRNTQFMFQFLHLLCISICLDVHDSAWLENNGEFLIASLKCINVTIKPSLPSLFFVCYPRPLQTMVNSYSICFMFLVLFVFSKPWRMDLAFELVLLRFFSHIYF